MQEPQKPKIWHFDPAASPTERQKALSKGQLYQLLEATEADEQKAVEFYNLCPVPGLEVGEVHVIYNKTFNVKFNEHLKTLQQRAVNSAFAPQWRSMTSPDLREKTHLLFEEKSKPYKDPDYPDVKLIPAWHGTKQERLDSLFQIGYSNLAIIDSGYFGKGVYSTYEAKYAYEVYTQNQAPGALILNWVAIFSPLPVINNGTYKSPKLATADKPKKPERYGDMCILMGKGNYGNYDAHFVPVVPKNPLNPRETDFFPCRADQKPMYTEIVVFESAACLPRYLVKLRSIPSPQTRLIEQRTKEERRQLLIVQQLKEHQLKKEEELKKQQLKEQRREERKLMEQQLQFQKQKIASQSQEISQKENELKTKTSDMGALKSENSELKKALQESKDKETIARLEQTLQAKDKMLTQKDAQLSQQSQENNQLSQTLQVKDKTLTENTSVIGKLKLRLDNSETKLMQSESKLTQAEKALQAAKDEALSLQLQLKEYQQQANKPVKISDNPFTTFQPMPPIKPSFQPTLQDQKDVELLFKWVTEGHLLEAEKLLQKNPHLALVKGTVKDLSDRTFTNTSAFQYAAWAYDIEMCELMLKYFDPAGAAAADIQLTELEKNPGPHGAHYDIDPLLKKTQEYLNNYSQWDGAKREQHWQKEVGGEQRKCPAWLIYAWCEKGADVAWVKKDLKNIKVIRQYNVGHIKWWFEEKMMNEWGSCWKWAFLRGAWRDAVDVGSGDSLFLLRELLVEGGVHVSLYHDKEVGQSVKPNCHEALTSLKAKLVNKFTTVLKK